jgi:hypothetical protein
MLSRDDIIEAASKAGFETKRDMIWVDQWEITPTLTRFATLVAAAERERIIAANAPEIERINAHIKELEQARAEERTRACRIVTGLCISDNNAREINEAICAQGQRTTQFCAVAEQARLEEREACARVCDAVAESANKAAVAGQYLIVRNGAEARRCSAAIRAQAADRLARHGISIPEDEEYGNPSF